MKIPIKCQNENTKKNVHETFNDLIHAIWNKIVFSSRFQPPGLGLPLAPNLLNSCRPQMGPMLAPRTLLPG